MTGFFNQGDFSILSGPFFLDNALRLTFCSPTQRLLHSLVRSRDVHVFQAAFNILNHPVLLLY